ncbi:DUF3159 domain-containing protein [Xylanimonas oleitrophica]|uniref:DUF3159 domain-containing protein n=1 Tax=Xylanimonas oleitrophica TaxID=2607479 RepID=A0A2W5YGM7_9MICO|nr:DUF3159 domain-containing protein [Xylanimonas oleitrophica]PZR53911.1 DUF3159 domain-containing protein [Xylanimonas oleitrophica]
MPPTTDPSPQRSTAQSTSADGGAPQAAARGVRAVTAEEFSFGDAVGGVRGVVEAVLPGLVFVVLFVATTNLSWALVAAVAAALVAVAVRLAQRTPVTQALGGLLGIAVGVFWAWRSGEAQNFYAVGLWTNAVYLVGMLVSLVVRWPVVGFVVESLKAGFSPDRARDEAAAGGNPLAGLTAWRSDPELMRRYALATWFWVGLFAVRLAVKVPLYLNDSVGWLGTAHLVLGVPLWGLVLWLTWAVVRRPRPQQAGADAPSASAGT